MSGSAPGHSISDSAFPVLMKMPRFSQRSLPAILQVLGAGVLASVLLVLARTRAADTAIGRVVEAAGYHPLGDRIGGRLVDAYGHSPWRPSVLPAADAMPFAIGAWIGWTVALLAMACAVVVWNGRSRIGPELRLPWRGSMVSWSRAIARAGAWCCCFPGIMYVLWLVFVHAKAPEVDAPPGMPTAAIGICDQPTMIAFMAIGLAMIQCLVVARCIREEHHREMLTAHPGAGICRSCGYLLDGNAGRCSECGTVCRPARSAWSERFSALRDRGLLVRTVISALMWGIIAAMVLAPRTSSVLFDRVEDVAGVCAVTNLSEEAVFQADRQLVRVFGSARFAGP